MPLVLWPPGANMGDFTIFLAAATGPSGVVYAFEPQARMFQLVCTNMIIK
jgi:FkbM family methyltransferase